MKYKKKEESLQRENLPMMMKYHKNGGCSQVLKGRNFQMFKNHELCFVSHIFFYNGFWHNQD